MGRPPKSAKIETKRIQVELPPTSLERLRRLQDVTESSSYAEVVRNALRLYEALIDEAEAGNEVLIKRKERLSRLQIFSA